MVKEIKTKQEFDEIISQSKLVVVDFTATWCGPCQRIAPVFSDLAEANPEVEFIKVDVDANEEVASACAIQSMPTFHFYKNVSAAYLAAPSFV